MRTKVTNFLLGLLVSGLLIYPGYDIAQAEGIDFSAAISLSSEVVGIDRENRTLLLKNPDGEVYSVKVPEIAQNKDKYLTAELRFLWEKSDPWNGDPFPKANGLNKKQDPFNLECQKYGG